MKELYKKIAQMPEEKALEIIAEWIDAHREMPDVPDCVFESDTESLKGAYRARQAEMLADEIGDTDDEELSTLQDMLIDSANIWAIEYQLSQDECKNLVWESWMDDPDNSGSECFRSVDLNTGKVYEPRQPNKQYEPNAERRYWKD